VISCSFDYSKTGDLRLAATLFVGCAWTDSPDTGMSIMITADGSRAAARAAAIHLARQIWGARRQFVFGCETAEPEEGVPRALAAKETTVFLTDSGDNVTASTPGDLPIVLRHLVESKVKSAVVASLNDKVANSQCFEAGEGPRAFTDVRQFESCGMNPLSRKLVVKEDYLFPGLTRIAPRYIMLLTPGAGHMRLERLNYTRRRKPAFPFEPDTVGFTTKG
jgi:microcystin degradation protein MlrC